MAEIYRIVPKGSKMELEDCEAVIPQEILAGKSLVAGWRVFCRMGDPAFLACLCWRRVDSPESIFRLVADDAVCFYAIAENGLAFALGLSSFGSMCANARLGADIFEESGDDDA